jgi:hypothetical protein
MKILKIFGCISLMLLLASPGVFAQQEDQAVLNYSLWMGAHYTGYEDYGKLIGEYMRLEDEAMPEFKFSLQARKKDGYLTFSSHFFDQNNIFARLSGKKGNRVDLKLQYMSLIHQDGQDLLANLEAREWLGTNPGGKMVTHELTDMGADYSTDRHEIRSSLSVLLSEKNKVRFSVDHRTILEKGNEQKLAISHCFSCHVESKDWDLDQQTHQLQAGLEAEVKNFEVGYHFGFRSFQSKVTDATGTWDVAKHPVSGLNGAEFGSRLIYDAAELPNGLYPDILKMSHTGKIRGKLGKGRLAGSFGYTHTENDISTLATNALTGALSYAVPVSKKSRLVAKVDALRLEADDVFIDLPSFREGRPDNHPIDFDFQRYSAVDRIQAKGTLEYITQVNHKTSLSLLGGYKSSERMDYPNPVDAYTTKTYIGQGKVRYREGMKFSGSLKYRYERTEDPLRSDRGLLEASGREVIDIYDSAPGFAFYYEREALRYLNVTSLPTDYHEVDLKTTIRPDADWNISAGLKTTYDKNGDLDTLDVKHYAFRPNVNLTVTPGEGVTFNGGYTYTYSMSRGPFAIPLFDG